MALFSNVVIPPFMPTEVAYASGAVSPSTRSRRSSGYSSDQMPIPEPDGLIEENLRAGGPYLCEFPCETSRTIRKDSVVAQDSYRLLTRLGDICRQENFVTENMFFCERQSVLDHTKESILTLLVYARRIAPTNRGWIQIARKLLAYLKKEGLQDISVEIVDPRIDEGPAIHPCYPDDAIFPIWTEVVEMIMANVDTTGVHTIGCYRVGSDLDRTSCPPTVLLGVDCEVANDWKSVREGVITILDKHDLNTVAVLIRKDSAARNAGSLESKSLMPSDCRQNPNMGFSISSSTVNNAFGTLGGWVELKDSQSGQMTCLALTCSHCCIPQVKGLNSEDFDVLHKWKQEGVRVGDPNASRLLTMDSPSYRDVQDGIRSIGENIAVLEQDALYRMAQNAKARNTFITETTERSWRKVSQMIQELDGDRRNMAEFLDQGKQRFGEVYAASGLREVPASSDPSRLSTRDWALVKPSSDRTVGENAIQTRKLPRLKQLDAFNDDIPEFEEQLHKIGRASGYTRCQYAKLRTFHISPRIVDGEEQMVCTWEHAVVSPRKELIVREGDSGSLLFNARGAVCGLIFGGTQSGDVAYFTCTADLLADIKQITGATEVCLRSSA